jgi:GT2 family glycosyltransferase
MTNDEITILIVAYKCDDIILKNLSNLNNFKVIIIDNFKDSFLKNKIRSFTNVKYEKQDINLGEGSGAQIGLKLVNTKYTLYLNPDTFINEFNILKLKDIFLRYSDIGLLTPLHLNQKNEYIPNYFIHPFNRKIKRNSFEKKIFNFLNDVKPSGDISPKCIWGAPLFFNTALIRKVGFFDINFFLFFEDVDLCDRVIKKNLKIILTNDAFCNHLNQDYPSKSIKYLFYTSSNFIFSQMYYFNKNNHTILHFYLRGFEYFLNSLIYLLTLNKIKFFQNIFRIYGIFKFILFKMSKTIKS